MTWWFIVWKFGSGALALRQIFHAWLVLTGNEGEGELPLFQAREQVHVSVQPSETAHTQQKHTCTQAHAFTPNQVHAVRSSPFSYSTPNWMSPPGHSPAPSPSSAGIALASSVCGSGAHLILGASLGNNGWISQTGIGEL